MIKTSNLDPLLTELPSLIADETTSLPRGLSGIVESFIENYYKAHEGLLPSSGLYERVLQEVERPLFQITLKRLQGNQKQAAHVLGIHRNTLRRKLTELNIDPNEFVD